MSATRVAVVALVLLAVAFVVVTARGQNANGDTPDWLRLLGSRFVEPDAVRRIEIRPAGGCFDGESGFLLVAGQPCEVTVAPSRRGPVRTLRLTLAAGRKVRLRVQPRGSDGVPLSVGLEAGRRPLTVQVFKAGADVSLLCEVPGPALTCRVTID